MRFEKILPQNSKRRKFVKKIVNKFFMQYTPEQKDYKKWIDANEPNSLELAKQKKYKFKINPKISIVIPLYNTPENFFTDVLNGMQKQTYGNWELCLADGSPEPIAYIKSYMEKEPRIKYSIIGENKGISGNTNEAIKLATGDFVGFMDHDDVLPPFAFYEIVKAINKNPDVEFIYTDEDKFEELDKPRYGVFFKPDFSIYTLRSANYINHFSIYKKELLDKLEGLKPEYDGSQDFDITLRMYENTKNIIHIPKVLYHWRVYPGSVSYDGSAKPYAYEVAKNVIKDHLKRCNLNVDIVDGATLGSYEVLYKVNGTPKVSVIIDASNIKENEKIEKIIHMIEENTYKNIEIIVISDEYKTNNNDVKIVKNISGNIQKRYNKTIKEIKGDYFIIIDENLIDIPKNNWIENLLGICQDKDVGIVGSKLYNEKEQIEHSGIILNMNRVGDFLYKGAPKDAGTYMQRLKIIHNVTAVYNKYAMIDKKVFEKIKGFNSKYDGMPMHIDTCLKILNQNYQVVINPIVEFCVQKLSNVEKIENQMVDFENEWSMELKSGDKYFSPNLRLDTNDLAIKTN